MKSINVNEIQSVTGGLIIGGINNCITIQSNNCLDFSAPNTSINLTNAVVNGLSHSSIGDIGTNTHTQIDTHLISSSNPHSITATQVGNTTAQWNANQLLGRTLSITAPTDGQLLSFNNTSGEIEWNDNKVWLIYDTKSTGTNGGDYSTENTWITRTLNTINNNGAFSDTASVILANDTITLLAGTYMIWCMVPAYKIKKFSTRLVDSANNVIKYGNSAYSKDDTSSSIIMHTWTIVSTKIYHIEMIGEQNQTNTGLGIPDGYGDEIYTQIKLIKLN
jgi:hypothetical protein